MVSGVGGTCSKVSCIPDSTVMIGGNLDLTIFFWVLHLVHKDPLTLPRICDNNPLVDNFLAKPTLPTSPTANKHHDPITSPIESVRGPPLLVGTDIPKNKV